VLPLDIHEDPQLGAFVREVEDALRGVTGRGLHWFTIRLNASAFCVLGGEFSGCTGGVKEVPGSIRGCVGSLL
jgi:hypothetical protein